MEQLTNGAPLVAWLLSSTAHLQVLATSRRRLGVEGEVEVALDPLATPDTDSVAAIDASPAGRLFLQRARAIGRLERLADDEAAAVAQLCRRVDGLPLALELAAARLRVLSPGAVLRRLTGNARSEMAGIALGDVLAWTAELLSEEQRALLAATSVCVGGFDLEMAAALAPSAAIVDGLDALVSVGLVRADPTDNGELRFRLLETVRAFGLGLLDPAAEAAARRAHAERIRDLVRAEAPSLRRRDSAQARARLRREHENIQAALDWSEANDPDLAVEVTAGLLDHWLQYGQFRRAVDRLRRLLTRDELRREVRARGLFALAWLEREESGTIGLATLTEAAEHARAAGDAVTAVRALELIAVHHAYVVRASDELARVIAAARELAKATDDPYVASYVSAIEALAWVGRDERRAIAGNRAAVDGFRHVGERLDEGGFLINIGISAYIERDVVAAAAATGEAVDAFRDVGLRSELAAALALHGAAQADLGRLDAARASLLESLDIATEVDSRLRLLEVCIESMAWAAAVDDGALVGRLWGTALRLMDDVGGELDRTDVVMGERYLAAARRRGRSLAVEAGIREGRSADPAAILAGLRERLLAPTRPGPRTSVRLRHADLTEREVQILRLVGEGRTDAEIATALDISPKTASVHVSNAKAKLGAESRIELALQAHELLGRDSA
jgi:predicted ATPase